MFACLDTIIPLLPPNSYNALPILAETLGANALPISVDPVALNKLILLSSAIHSASVLSPSTTCNKSLNLNQGSGKVFSTALSHATLQLSVTFFALGEPFHTTLFPHTIAKQWFHAQTAQGKLKAVITPTTPNGL